ncbi:hypothetical protein BDV97DRAFT_88808 [Delphinella strobiligena]|nr:hypothetical protein BDV97DRAFT_88808 [Delphinella strobiligena]
MYGLLNHQNMRASKLSTMKMEKVTDGMHQIAKRTQQETVSMRIITLITLIFLPGTFVSTIMSTDIVTWDTNSFNQQEKTVFTGAVKFFLMLTFPLIFATFAAWAGFYWSEKRKERKRWDEDETAFA